MFLLRLLSLLVVVWSAASAMLAPFQVVAFAVIGGTSVAGLMRSEWLGWVSRHPSLSLIDVAVVAAMYIYGGMDSPFALTALTSAVLVGIWVDLLGGLIVMVTLLSLYFAAALIYPTSVSQGVAFWVIPFSFLSLWYLALVLQRSLAKERRHYESIARARASAAGSAERATMARELHDSLAKTLQAVAMSSSALESTIARDPHEASNLARHTHRTAAQAVSELRVMMGELRDNETALDLGEAVAEAVHAWEARTGRDCILEVDMGVTASSSAQQYELLTCLTECLDNVCRHAGPCDVHVTLARSDDSISAVIRDTGKGVAPDDLAAAQRAGHAGVSGLQERMIRVGGRAEFDSAPGKGTTVRLTAPDHLLVERR